MNKVILHYTQTDTRAHFIFPSLLKDVRGCKFELITHDSVSCTDPTISLECPEVRNFGINTGYIGNTPSTLVWTQPYFIPPFDQQLKSTKFNFSPRDFKELHLDLKSNTVTLPPGSYMVWKITFYF